MRRAIALTGLLMAVAAPAAAQLPSADTDSAHAEIRTALRAFYFNLAHQDWEALAADILSAKIVASRPVPEALLAAASTSAAAHGAAAACRADAPPPVDQAAITLDGNWAGVSVPRCTTAAAGADEFRFFRFERRWRAVYIELFREPDTVQLAR